MATIQGLIAAKRARIEARVGTESDLTDDLIEELVRLRQAETNANGAAPTVVDAASIGAGIGIAPEIGLIKDALTAILGELVNAKAFADVLVQDTAKNYFIRREIIDQTTGGPPVVQIERLDGTAGAPVGVLVPIKNGGGDSIIEDKYYALATGTGFSIGDSLSNVRLVDGETRAVSSLGWFNITTQQLLTIAPGVAAIKGYEDLIEELLTKIASALPAALGAKPTAQSLAVALPTDLVLPLPTGAATALSQDEEILALEAIGSSVALAATEATLLSARNRLDAIALNTASAGRLLTVADVVTIVPPATMATALKQDEQKTALDTIDAKLALASTAAKQDTIVAALGQLLVELSKQKEFEDLIVQDAAGTAFIRREEIAQTTGLRTIRIENFDGTLGAPVGTVTTVKQIRGNNIVSRNYYAKAAGTGFAAGDSLSTMQIVNGETETVTLLGWFNITQQTSINAPATSAIAGYEDRIEELLAQIVGQLPANLGAKTTATSLAVTLPTDGVLPLPTGAATEGSLVALIETIGDLLDVSTPPNETADATIKGLLRTIAKYINDNSATEVDSIGEAVETLVVSTPSDFGSLKSVLRGLWANLQRTIGDEADASANGLGAPGSIKSLLRSGLGLLVDGTQTTTISDGTVDGYRAGILAPTTNATTEPALVVAISPRSQIDVNSLPGTVAADLAAIKASSATIATNTANITRYSFNLAQTTAGLTFLIRTDGVTGASTYINVATGATIVPGSIELTDPIAPGGGGGGSGLAIEPNEFEAITTNGSNWAIGDILTRVLIVDPTTGAVSSTIWQSAAGATLSVVPVVGTDVIDGDRQQLTVLRQSVAAMGQPVDAPAAGDTGSFGMIAAIKRLLGKIQNGSQPLARAVAVAMSTQVTTSFTSVGGSTNLNLFDASGLGAGLDVSDYNSCKVTVVGGTAGLSYILESALNAAFTSGVSALNWFDTSGVEASSGTVSGNQTKVFGIDLANVSFIRLRQTTTTAGVNVSISLSQAVGPIRTISSLAVGASLGSVGTLNTINDASAGSTTIGAIGVATNTLGINGRGVATFGITGGWVGTIQIQYSTDALGWINLTNNNSVYNLTTKTFVNNGNLNSNGLYQVNVAGVPFVRAIATAWGTGAATIVARATVASSLVAIEGQVTAVVSGNLNTVAAAQLAPNVTLQDLAGTITASATSTTFTQTWGNSRTIEVNLTTLANNTTLTLEVQEPVGPNWRTVYKFAPITALGAWRSPPLPNTSTNWRYVETFSGSAPNPSATRTITHTQSNLNVSAIVAAQQLGGFNVSDLPIFGKVRQVVANNQSTVKMFLQVYNKATALVPADVPLAKVFPIAPGGVVALTAADLGEFGTLWGVNPRVAISTTFSTYTAPAVVAAPNQTFALNVEVV